MALTKATYSIIDHNTVNAKDFGVDISGATDSSAAMQLALNACAGGKVLRISGSITVSQRLTMPSTIGGIFGDGQGSTTITFTREQTSSSIFDNSLFIIDAVSGASFKDFKIEYTGTFYQAGQSNFGAVSGLLVRDSDDVLIERIEATGFNHAGIYFTANTRTASNLCKRNSVINCYLHHNRVAGCLFSFQEQFHFMRNLCSYNGHVSDGGTGYGVASLNSTPNKLVSILNNTTDHNYRKGIDSHDCQSVVINDNILNGDRIYGIDVLSVGYDLNIAQVNNNIIEVDPTFYVSADDDQPAGTYSFYRAIIVQVDPLASSSNSIPDIQVNNNLIKNMGCDDSSHELTGIIISSISASDALIECGNNKIRGTKSANSYIDGGIKVSRGGSTPGITSNIHDNSLRVGPINDYGIVVAFNNTGLTNNYGECWVERNYIAGASSAGNAILVEDGGEKIHVNNNIVEIATISNPAIVVENTPSSELWIANNSIASSSGSANIIVFNDNNIVNGSGNTYNDALLSVPNKRINASGGSNKKIVSSRKSLTASTPTDICWLAEDGLIAHCTVKWSAYYNESGPDKVYMAGGLLSFVAGVSDNNEQAASSITAVATHAAKTGASSDLTVTWSIATATAGGLTYKLVANASADCIVYAEVEQINVLDISDVGVNYTI